MLKFWPEFPFKLFQDAKDIVAFEQTAEQAKTLIQKAEIKRQRIRERNLRNDAWDFAGFVQPNNRVQPYTSERGAKRRYQLGRV